MTILSGYTASLPINVLLGSMVIYIDGAVAYGATQGDPSVNLPQEYENLAFDGKMSPMVGLDRPLAGLPSIEGTFIEMTAAKALDLVPGGTTASSGGITTITPPDRGGFLVAADYKQNVRAVCRLGGASAGIVAIEFDWALLIVESLAGQSAGNGMVKLRFEARLDAAAAVGAPLFKIKMAADLATIVAADP